MKPNRKQFFGVRVESVLPGHPLPYDLYLRVNGDYVLFRKVGELVTEVRMKGLINHQLKQFHIPLDQQTIYREALMHCLQRNDLKPEQQAKFIKEAAFSHIHELFTNSNIEHLVRESTALVTEMVNLISDDLEGAANLMRLSKHDYYTYNHSVNVGVYTIAIAKKILGPGKEDLIKAGLGGLLHDLGKRAISRDIINKPGKLTEEEWAEIKKHPTYGCTLLEKVSCVSLVSRRMVQEHHENVDGTGYPHQLTDKEISPFSKIAAVADVFDALTTNRSYKKGVSPADALQIMFGMAPGKFDPAIFKYFDKSVQKKHPLTMDKDCDPCVPGVKIKKLG